MKKILGLLAAVLIFSGCIAEAESDEATETNAETQRADSLQARLDSLEAITGDTLVTDTLVTDTLVTDTLVTDTIDTDTIDTSLECVAESFTITKQISEKTFTGCVESPEEVNYYKNGKLHRVDGPAVENTDGTFLWYLNGELHREDGPAIEYFDGEKRWFLNNYELTEEEFNAR